MNHQNAFYRESAFGGFTDYDGTICFYNRVNSLITASSVLLDFGCGRGSYGQDPVMLRRGLRVFKGKVAHVLGMDTDENAKNNPFLDEFRLLSPGTGWPVQSGFVDVIVADSVVEHLDDPGFFFSECKRVLKPGGYLCLRTSNLLSYVGIGSFLIPDRLHFGVLKYFQEGREERDVFPTYYRCNTVYRVRKMMRKYGFRHACYGYEPEPNYLAFSRIAYALGVLYQTYAPGAIRSVIFAFGALQR